MKIFLGFNNINHETKRKKTFPSLVVLLLHIAEFGTFPHFEQLINKDSKSQSYNNYLKSCIYYIYIYIYI